MGVEIRPEYFFRQKGRTDSFSGALRKVPRPACAIIAVPDDMHEKAASAAMSEGLHTLVVKPLAPTLREARSLIELQEKMKVYCAVEYHKRLDEANLKLRDVIEEGVIGDPLYVIVEFSQKKSMPEKIFRKWVASANVFQYLGVHYVDIIYFAAKAIPKRAMAAGQKGWLVSRGIDVYDSVQGIIEWQMPNGKKFVSHILTNWVDPESMSAMSEQSIKVIGTRGRFESDQKRRGVRIITDRSGAEEPNPYFCASFGRKGRVSYSGYGIRSIHQFMEDVAGIDEGRVTVDDLECVRPTFKQSLVPTAVLEAVNESLAGRSKWVEIRI
jgi:predicted dehydrogenase